MKNLFIFSIIIICFCLILQHSPLLIAQEVLPDYTKGGITTEETIQCSGVVTEWVDGKEKILSGAKVIVGKQISLVVGNSGIDTIKGKITATTTTNSKGYASVSIPKGTYTVIIWKAGYVPQTYTGVEAKSYKYMGSISKDKSMQGLHMTLVFE